MRIMLTWSGAMVPELAHSDRLALMDAVDDLLPPWKPDLLMRLELASELERPGRWEFLGLWRQP